jgi:ribosomal protein S18 acetylase RimI-like enzyme
MNYKMLMPASLSKKQIDEITILVGICNDYDKTHYVFDECEDFKSESDINTFLLYDESQLISAVTLFVPNKAEAELLAFTLPPHRRKGLFRKLLQEVETELRRRKTDSILFVCDRNSKEGMLTIYKTKSEYDYSEFLMKYNEDKQSGSNVSGKVTVQEAHEQDKGKLIQINKNAFNEKEGEPAQIIDEIFKSNRRKLFSIIYDGILVGMIGIYTEEERKYIYGFCVDKEYQGRGIGKQALQKIVIICLKEKDTHEIVLEVQTDNENALKLYTQVGFQVVTEFKYFRSL